MSFITVLETDFAKVVAAAEAAVPVLENAAVALAPVVGTKVEGEVQKGVTIGEEALSVLTAFLASFKSLQASAPPVTPTAA